MHAILFLLTLVAAAVLAAVSEELGWYCLPLALGYVVSLMPLWPHLRRGDRVDQQRDVGASRLPTARSRRRMGR